MKFGVGYFPTDEGVDPATLARMAEERGFESLFFTDHTHIPASRETPYPAGGELPPEYSRIYDPFVALMAAAAATERLKLGTGDLPRDRARPDRHREGRSRASTGSPAGGCCSASAPAGTARRCATTAPTRRGASGSCASGSRR